ncbi:MAG: monovalent cation/H+ antiporter subunit D family protein, partial [Mariniblastus sp.]|nr:monovalent cation/H+ antiporter subunit D family protein [Mariniblastus sp.]
MIFHQLPILLIVIPLMTAPLLVILGNRKAALPVALSVVWSVFAIAIALINQVAQTGPIEYELGGWSSPYGIVYVVDHLSSFVILFVSGLGAIVLTYAPASINREVPHSKHYLFYATYLLCMTGLLGMCITGDLFNVFVFLEISSLSSYALISLGKTRRAPLAALQYLIFGTIGATFFLIGIGLLYQMTGTLNMADIASRLALVDGSRTKLVAFAFMTAGLFIKMAVFPLHTWLPNAYTYAPSVVTAFIAATATKVSVYAFIRLVYLIFTPQFAFETLPLDNALMVLSLIGIFVASAAAIYQTDIKRLLAYSSVAQIGYMLLGISMANLDGLTAGIVHMFNHALIKGGLFMVVGCFVYRLGSAKLDDLRGAGKTMPWTSFAWAIGGLGLIGVPLTAGFISKWLLLTSALHNNWWGVAVLMLASSLLAVIYVWRVVELLYFSEPSKLASSAKEAPLTMLVPTYVVIAATVVFGCWTV